MLIFWMLKKLIYIHYSHLNLTFLENILKNRFYINLFKTSLECVLIIFITNTLIFKHSITTL